MAFRISSEGLGVAWQLGSPRIDIKNDGRRWVLAQQSLLTYLLLL
jgi:hypothetical protein